MQTPKIHRQKKFIILKCPIGCSHHIFPVHFNFCPYCGLKLKRYQRKKLEYISKSKNQNLETNEQVGFF